MLGNIPLVKGVHVIFTEFHDCVLHIRVPTECPTAGTPVSPSAAENFSFHGYLRFLCIGLGHKFALQYTTENLSDGQLVLIS
jgi:hypothetical protein